MKKWLTIDGELATTVLDVDTLDKCRSSEVEQDKSSHVANY